MSHYYYKESRVIPRNILFILFAGLFLFGCKNPTAPSYTEPGYQSDDLDELRKSPEYVDLSKYELDDPEDSYVPKISPEEPDSEDNPDVIHIKYDRPVNGYTVTVDLFDGNFAKMHFDNGSSGFTVEIDSFEEPQLYDLDTGTYNGEEIVLKYIPLPSGEMISDNCTFFFSDVDFDGKEELLVTDLYGGPRGMNAYTVYEKGQKKPRMDPPFDIINDWTRFNAKLGTISQSTYYGFLDEKSALREDLIYTLQSKGRFVLTDSILVTMRLIGNKFVDSLATHYRRKDDKMVLVKDGTNVR